MTRSREANCHELALILDIRKLMKRETVVGTDVAPFVSVGNGRRLAGTPEDAGAPYGVTTIDVYLLRPGVFPPFYS